MTILFVVLIIVVIVIAKKINIAIALIEESSTVVLRLPCLVVLPLVTAVVIIMFTAWWLFLMAMIASLEDFTIDTVLESFTNNETFDDCAATVDVSNLTLTSAFDDVDEAVQSVGCYALDFAQQYGHVTLELVMIAYHIFMYLWTVQFIHAVMICIVAGAVCDWYWTRPSGPKDDPNPKQAFKGGDGKWGDPLCKSCCRTFRFHLGSMMFGSFVVALVQVCQFFVLITVICCLQ